MAANPMASVVNAEVECLERAAALYDARFARTVLFAIGMIVAAGGFSTGIIGALVLGGFALATGWYFQAFYIPRLEREMIVARYNLSVAIGRLGQYFPGE